MIRLTRILDPVETAQLASPHALELSLTWDQRNRSRLALMPTQGPAVALTLPRGAILRDGAVLAGDDDATALVRAAPEPVHRARLHNGQTPLDLLRAVYHLANRHVALQLAADHVCFSADPVLAEMVVSLGLAVDAATLPFEPESGAYHGGHHRHGDGTDAQAERDLGATVGEALSRAAHQSRA